MVYRWRSRYSRIKSEEKMEDVSKPLVSYEISDEEEIKKNLIQLNWTIKFRKKILISDLNKFYECHKTWSVQSHKIQHFVTKFWPI